MASPLSISVIQIPECVKQIGSVPLVSVSKSFLVVLLNEGFKNFNNYYYLEILLVIHVHVILMIVY